MTTYAFGTTVDLDFGQALTRLTEVLMKEGFGVLTEIDVAATLKQKIGKEMPAYRILGACNPSLAGRAIDLEPQIGALLPCNVVVRIDAQGATRVEFMDPRTVLGLVDRPGIEALANEVHERLTRVMQSL